MSEIGAHEIRAQLIHYAPGLRMSPHADGVRRLSVLIAGDLTEADRGREERAAPGSVALKAPGFVHHNRFGGAGTVIVSVLLPDPVVKRLGHSAADLASWRWHHGADGWPGRGHAGGEVSLAGWRLAAGLRRAEGELVHQALRALLGAFRDTGVRRRGGTIARESFRATERSESEPTARLRRIEGLLRRSPGAISVDRLAHEEGIHPVSLGRSFRRHFGCSITCYRQRLRVARAVRALVSGTDDLVGIALDQGFSDLSHLTRVFRREVGVPPGEFRAGLRDLLAAGHPRRFETFKTEWEIRL